MPTCAYFLRSQSARVVVRARDAARAAHRELSPLRPAAGSGCSLGDACPYSHVFVNPPVSSVRRAAAADDRPHTKNSARARGRNAPVCPAFQRGYCPASASGAARIPCLCLCGLTAAALPGAAQDGAR